MGRLENAELRLPKWLSMPWLLVSQALGRRPMLDYAGCVLNNWERIDPERPLKPSNLRLLRRFTGLVDEEWFFKTHIIIEVGLGGWIVFEAHDGLESSCNPFGMMQKCRNQGFT